MTDPLDPLLRHRAAVRRLATRLVGADHADDVVQETYLRAIRQPPHGDAMSWLARIATNVVRFHGRSESRRRARETALANGQPDTEPSSDSVLVEIEASERVGRALRELAEPYRTTLVQRYFLDWSTERIAREAGISEPAVRQRQKRAIDLLRTAMQRGHGAGPGISPTDLRAAFGIPLALPPVLGTPASHFAPTATLHAVAAAPAAAGTAVLLWITMKTSTALGILTVALLGAGLFGAWSMFGSTSTPTAQPERVEPMRSTTERTSTATEETADATRFRTTTPTGVDPGGADAAPTDDSATVTLRVHALWDDDGTPAAEIVMFARRWDSSETADPSRFRAVSDADGLAVIDGLPPGHLWIDGMFNRAERRPTTVTGEAGTTAELELRLMRGATVHGRVVDATGHGIGGAGVLMAGWAEAWARPITVADADGRFRLVGIAGNASIGATADGFVMSRLRQLTVGEGSEQSIEIALAPSAAQLRLRVLDLGGAPIEGARVAIGPLGRQNNPEMGVGGAYELVVPALRLTDADGRIAAFGVPAGASPIEVAADGFSGWIGELDASPAASPALEHELRLMPDIEAVGTVRDSAGLPIEGVYVAHGQHGHLVHASTQTDAEGRFRLRGLPTGEVTMHAQNKGQDLRETLPTSPGRALRWDPTFGAEQSLRGVLRRVDGTAVPDATVSVHSSRSSMLGHVRSGAGGTFSLGIPAEIHAIRMHVGVAGSFERRVYEGAIPTTELELTLGPEFELSARIRGRLVDATERPVVNAQIWYGLDGQGNSYGIELDQDGAFSVAVAPGAYQFRIEALGYAIGQFNASVTTDETKDLGPIRLEAPASIRIEFGTSVAAPGPIGLRLTHVERGTSHRVPVRDGVGELGALPPGLYRLQINGKGIASEIREVLLDASRDAPTLVTIEVVAGVDLEFAVTLPAGTAAPSPLTLSVLDAGGATVLNRPVWLRANGTLDSDFALAPGTYRVLLDGGGWHAERSLAIARGASGPVTVDMQLRN